jgi:hypothetical protein
MILPMMGLLFALFTMGAFGAGILCLIAPMRRLAPFALIPVLAAVGAFALCWGFAVAFEWLFSSDRAGGIGFFTGYPLGGILGGVLGLKLALLIGRRVSAIRK